MEFPEKKVVLQAFRTNIISSESGLDQQDEPESNQEALQLRTSPPTLALIELRIQNLNSRRQFLLQMQQFKKKNEDHDEQIAEEMVSEDSGDLCELEAIQKELEELMNVKEAMQKQEESSNKKGNGGPKNPAPACYRSETPRGGIYMLPPLQKTEEDVSLEQQIKTTPNPVGRTGSVAPVDSVNQMSAAIHCPSCKQMVFTDTHRTFGEVAWVVCCLCSMLGCFAGCCLFPFFVDSWKTVHHQCPQCRTHICTSHPI